MNSSEQDPWTWGIEDNAVEEPQHNEWAVWGTPTAVSSELKKNKGIPNQVKYPCNQGSDYFDSVSLQNTSQQQQHQNWPQSGDSIQTNFPHYSPQPSAANYFNNNSNNNNNNSQNDVENKEVAPPDNQYNRNAHQSSLLKDPKSNRICQEQRVCATPQVNQNVHLSGSSGPPLAAPLFGPKQYAGPINYQDNTFQNPANHPNPVISSVPNASYHSTTHYNTLSTSHSAQSALFFSTPSLRSGTEPGHQMLLNSSADIPSQKPSDSVCSFPGPNSLPPPPQSAHGMSSNSEEYGGHYSTKDSNVSVSNSIDVYSKDRFDMVPPQFSSNDSAPQSVRHHDVSSVTTQREHVSSQATQQSTASKEKSYNNVMLSVTDNESASNQSDFPDQFPKQNVLHEEAVLHPPLVHKVETKGLNEISSLHQNVHQVALQPQEFNKPIISNQLSHPHQFSDPNQSAVPQQQPITHQISVSHQTTYPYPTPVSYPAAVPHKPPLSHQQPASQQYTISQQPPTSQAPFVSPQLISPQQVPVINPTPVSLGSSINSQQSISHQPPVNSHPPVSFSHPPATNQPLIMNHPPFSHQPPFPHHPSMSHQLPVSNLTSLSYQPLSSTNQLPFSNQHLVSHTQDSVDSKNCTTTNTERNLQELTLLDTEKIETVGAQNLNSNVSIESSPSPQNVNQCNSPGSSSLSLNSQNKDKETENTSKARYSPSPHQLHPSQTPPIIHPSQNSKNSQNINSTALPHISNSAGENIPVDNEALNYSVTNDRNQISFSLQNVPPMASSSPVSVQNIPENQERLPENHELPDNTENLRIDMKNLSLSREREIEAQVHCQVDRNQYLETGHLSGSKDHILNDNSPNIEAIDESEAPPPGLHRLVTGQGCETRGPTTVGDHPLLMVGADASTVPDSNRHSSPSSSTVGSVSDTRNAQSGLVGESEGHVRTGRLVQGQSIGDDTDGVREVPGEATPFHNRIVLGQMGRGVTPPLLQDSNTARGDNSRDREIVGRMVLGERYDRDLPQNVSTQDEFRQSHRSLRRSRRAESSYEDEDHEYPSDRDRRVDEYKRRGDDRDRVRHRTRREHRSPEYRSDEEFEDRRGFSRMGRSERRPRDFSPEVVYYGNYRDDHRRHRRYDHYRDYEDDYYYRENRSRPSSRTGSDYRRTNMEYMYGRVNARPMFYPDVGAITYNPRAPEEYYEAMRRLDPMGYAAWYNQYMSSRYNVQQAQGNFSNDRASVHSGQSSTNNNRPNVETPQAGVEDLGREEDFVSVTAHIKGKIDSHGRLLVIDPHYPTENQKATVNLLNISKLSSDPDLDEFLEGPGPFIPGITHRNTVLQYLRWISDRSTKSSEKLLYDLIHLSVKSNGELNGLDVADLLMDSYKRSQIEEESTLPDEVLEQKSIKDNLTKFRELLQQGNKTEALEWAIDHGAWGHALFLASKMDERTHNNIMLRFANSIPHTDPLQTLYQLMSGHVPQASTCCADKKWSDWRPHLAMILGNPTGNLKLDRKAIIKLGDSLFARGRIFASHFCYITAQADFTNYQSDAKLVLLGSNPNQEFVKFATCRAIMVTMCYEYGLKLRQASANIPSLQLYKLILANRLTDCGKSKIALQYCELIANEAVRNECCGRSLISSVISLSSKLKMLDPTLALTGDTESDPDWLVRLKNYYNNLSEDYDAGLMMSRGVSSSTVSDVGQDTIASHQEKIDNNDEMTNFYNNETTANCSKIEYSVPSIPQAQSGQQPLQPLTVQTSLPTEVIHEEEQKHQTYQPSSLPPLSSNSYNTELYPQQSAMNPYWNSSNGMNSTNSYTRAETIEATTVSNSKNSFFKASEEQLKLNDISKESNRSNTKTNENKASNKLEESQHSGWFGGIWEKLSIRPKNQMRLPDDNNPSIVWDEQKKKWVNLDGDDDGHVAVKPPPKMAETTKSQQPQPLPSDNLPPPAPSGGNKYKIQKGKLMKSNYVNIMGTTNKNQQNTVHPMDGLFANPVQASNTNFFVPSPAEGNEYPPADFINTGTTNNTKSTEGNLETKQLSRSSSVSSLSREVQYYMAPRNSHIRASDFPQGITAPTMYNPSRYPVSNDC